MTSTATDRVLNALRIERIYGHSYPSHVLAPGEPSGAPGQWAFSDAPAGDDPGPSTQSAPAEDGLVTMAGPQDSPGTIWISVRDSSGTDQSIRIGRIFDGVIIRISEVDDATHWQEYVAVGPAVPDGPSAVRLDGVVHWNRGFQLSAGAAVVFEGRLGTNPQAAKGDHPHDREGAPKARGKK